jgi:phosphoribosylaminoimidazolecarboxamide formyltransferase/IMP cyclohydrolase
MAELVKIHTALLSVSDKTDLVPFARALQRHGVRLISTGGTARALADAGLEVVPVEQVTGFPEMMDGRVKTLHPKVHGGLLALRDKPDHADAMRQHGIDAIDLVCVNLYPFEQTVAREGVTDAEAVEQIDIGGPAMIRSSAKNHRFVACVTDPSQYDSVSTEMKANGGATSLALRRTLATAAFTRTAAYDAAISRWMTTRWPAPRRPVP